MASYGVGSPTVGPTSSSVRLHIYVPSHEISFIVTLNNQFTSPKPSSAGHTSSAGHISLRKIAENTLAIIYAETLRLLILSISHSACTECYGFGYFVELNWLFNVTINDRLSYCLTLYQRLRLYNDAPFSRLLRHAGDTEDVFSA